MREHEPRLQEDAKNLSVVTGSALVAGLITIGLFVNKATATPEEMVVREVQPVVIEVVEVPAEGALPFEPASFDAVLVDAPCTNTGVLALRVEARWRAKPDDAVRMAAVQGDILERALPLLKPGGTLVYSTCSIEPEENAGVFDAFVARHDDVEGEIAFRAWPTSDHDGGFAAVLRRSAT